MAHGDGCGASHNLTLKCILSSPALIRFAPERRQKNKAFVIAIISYRFWSDSFSTIALLV
jgi:hypothetical protein